MGVWGGTTNLPSVYHPFSPTCNTSKSDGDGTKLLNYQIYRLPPTRPYIYIYKRFCVDVLFMRSFTYSGSVDWMCTNPPSPQPIFLLPTLYIHTYYTRACLLYCPPMSSLNYLTKWVQWKYGKFVIFFQSILDRYFKKIKIK